MNLLSLRAIVFVCVAFNSAQMSFRNVTTVIIRRSMHLLRPVTKEDAPFLTRLNNDEIVARNVVEFDFPSTIDGVYENATNGISRKRFIVLDACKEPVGVVGFWNISERHRNAEIGIKIATNAERGTGSRALSELIDFGFCQVGFHRLYARILSGNTRSVHVFHHKLGFKHEGTERSSVWRHGQYQDIRCLGMLCDEWAQRNHVTDALYAGKKPVSSSSFSDTPRA